MTLEDLISSQSCWAYGEPLLSDPRVNSAAGLPLAKPLAAEHSPGTPCSLHFTADTALCCFAMNVIRTELRYFPLLCPDHHTQPDSISQWFSNEMERISVKCSIKQQQKINRCHKVIRNDSLSPLGYKKKTRFGGKKEERNHNTGTITVEDTRQRKDCKEFLRFHTKPGNVMVNLVRKDRKCILL